MKRKALVALALLVVATLLVGCGGVSQEEYDAAVAEKNAAQNQAASLQSQLTTAQNNLTAANTAKATAEADLATCQSSLTKANSDLTAAKSSLSTAQAEVTALEAEVAALEADLAACEAGGGGGEEEEPPPSGGFTGTKYSDTTYGFSFQYPTDWTERTGLGDYYIKFFGGAPYYVPGIYAVQLDQSVATDMEGAFKKYLELLGGSYTFKSFSNATSVTISGQACTKADIVYTGAYGDLDGTMVGFTKNSKWVLIGVIQYPGIGASFASATQKDDIIGSITFP